MKFIKTEGGVTVTKTTGNIRKERRKPDAPSRWHLLPDGGQELAVPLYFISYSSPSRRLSQGSESLPDR